MTTTEQILFLNTFAYRVGQLGVVRFVPVTGKKQNKNKTKKTFFHAHYMVDFHFKTFCMLYSMNFPGLEKDQCLQALLAMCVTYYGNRARVILACCKGQFNRNYRLFQHVFVTLYILHQRYTWCYITKTELKNDKSEKNNNKMWILNKFSFGWQIVFVNFGHIIVSLLKDLRIWMKMNGVTA